MQHELHIYLHGTQVAGTSIYLWLKERIHNRFSGLLRMEFFQSDK